MRFWGKHALIFLLAAIAALTASAQQRTYQAFNGNVPFSFSIGDRNFHAGFYEFVIVGAGVMAMRDAHQKVISTLITRQLQGEERDVAPRFVFEKTKGHLRLVSIWMEKGAQGLQILGEEVAMRSSPPVQYPPLLNPPVSHTPSLMTK